MNRSWLGGGEGRSRRLFSRVGLGRGPGRFSHRVVRSEAQETAACPKFQVTLIKGE